MCAPCAVIVIVIFLCPNGRMHAELNLCVFSEFYESEQEHLPYKPLESTLSDEKLFIEIVFAENLSRPNA